MRACICFLSMLLALLCGPSSLPGQTWVEDSFDDFADGRLDAAGQNLYVARDGTIRTIHRFDLNQDGYLDLVFNSTHDTSTFIPATLASVGCDGTVTSAELAVRGSRQVVVSDLNRDGHFDLVFCPNRGGAQTGRRFVTIIYGGSDGWPASRSTGRLPVHDAQRLVVVDVNSDGWSDIAVLNGEAWLPGQPVGAIIRIFWGSRDGYELSHRADVGVAAAIDVAGDDLDGDGAADLVVLTSQPAVQILWASKTIPVVSGGGAQGSAATEPNWQSKLGTLNWRQVPLPNSSPTCLAAGDVDNDGHVDLLVATRDGAVHVVREISRNRNAMVETVAATRASHIAIGNLDGDGRADLVLSDFATARSGGGEAIGAAEATANFLNVLWGADGGFSSKRATQIPIRDVMATAIGDVNADGRPDLVAAVHQGERTLTTESAVFLGTGQRTFQRARSGPQTTGASDVAIVPASGLRPAQIVLCNSLGGALREEVPITVYWGAKGGFDPQNVWNIPFASGYESTAADFNQDGFVDLLAINSGHAGAAALASPHLGANIFWGSAAGFDIDKRRSVLRELNLGTSNVADLDRDGWLDIVLGQFFPAKPGTSSELIIRYGGAGGFEQQRRVAIPAPGRSISTVIADFDRDAWLDIAVSSFERDVVRVFFGSAHGFDAARQATLPIHSAVDVETADLNADGYLDLIVGSYHDRLSGLHDTGTTLLWGGRGGFRATNAQWLPGFTPVGHCVADFDADGHLDLFSPHYHASGTRESIPSYLFWGGPDGFATERRTAFICDSAHDALAADFNGDGRLDLAVVCHARDGDHVSVSKIFHNDGRRFANPKVASLPTVGPHWMWQEDMGHIAHRRWEQTYESSTFRWDQPARHGRLRVTADVPRGSRLVVSVRSAVQAAQLAERPWRKLRQGRFSLEPTDRVVQYRATFTSDNGDRYAVLDRVELTVGRGD